MARLNDDAQWIVMMGFIVSFSFFFLAMILNQSTVVGQTTAESVLDFPKNDIRDVRSVIIQAASLKTSGNLTTNADVKEGILQNDIQNIEMMRKNALVNYTVGWPVSPETVTIIDIHYNNGVTSYNETWTGS
jgi:hypothetical protein